MRLAKGGAFYRDVRAHLQSPKPSDIWFDDSREAWLLTFEELADPEHVYVFAVAAEADGEPRSLATVHEIARSDSGWRSSRLFPVPGSG